MTDLAILGTKATDTAPARPFAYLINGYVMTPEKAIRSLQFTMTYGAASKYLGSLILKAIT